MENEVSVNLHRLPSKWQRVVDTFISIIKDGRLDDFIGISPHADCFRVYHGSRIDKIPKIVDSGGMRAFYEDDAHEPGIFVTPSPTNALWHAIESGPHDTLRKEGKIQEVHRPEDAVLLLIETPKSWLTNQQEAIKVRQSKLQEWIRQAKRLPSTFTRLGIFVEGLQTDVAAVKNGGEANSFGVRFPVDFIPEDYICVVAPDGKTTKIKDYNAGI